MTPDERRICNAARQLRAAAPLLLDVHSGAAVLDKGWRVRLRRAVRRGARAASRNRAGTGATGHAAARRPRLVSSDAVTPYDSADMPVQDMLAAATALHEACNPRGSVPHMVFTTRLTTEEPHASDRVTLQAGTIGESPNYYLDRPWPRVFGQATRLATDAIRDAFTHPRDVLPHTRNAVRLLVATGDARHTLHAACFTPRVLVEFSFTLGWVRLRAATHAPDDTPLYHVSYDIGGHCTGPAADATLMFMFTVFDALGLWTFDDATGPTRIVKSLLDTRSARVIPHGLIPLLSPELQTHVALELAAEASS